MTEEMLDYYDANMTHLGVKARSAVHQVGDWHRVFHCWVIYRDTEGRDFIVVQKRSHDKATFPDLLDVSAAGHYEAGETMRDGIREVHEELGLDVAFEQVIPAGRRVSAAKIGDLLDYEVADVFFYICDQPLKEYAYQREEVAGLVKIDLAAAELLFEQDVEFITCEAVGFGVPEIEVRVRDFIPTQDNYFLKTMLLAKRCLDGDRNLWV